MNISDNLKQRLEELMHRFLTENEMINLSALRTSEKCWIGNILDSLPLVDAIPDMKPQSRILDLGTGGGFPLLPLALALPDIRFTGLDSTAKKIKAIERIAADVKIPNLNFIIARAEEAGRDAKHREKFDVVTSRAVAELSLLFEYAAPFVKVGGTIAVWKSLHIEEELEKSKNAQKVLGCTLTRSHKYTLPGDFGERQILLFTKETPTDKTYPRAVGEAKRLPL